MLEITTNANVLAVRYGDAAKLVASTIVQALRDIGTHLHRIVVNEKLSRGGILEPRTGTLKRSVRSAANDSRAITVTPTEASTRVWFDPGIAIYGHVQEVGGTIHAKRVANLTIPLPAMQTAGGVARGTAREVIANPMAFGFWRTFTAKRVIFGATRFDDITPLFVLRPSVTLPARAPLATTLQDERGWIGQRIGAATEAVAQELGGAS